MSERRRRSLAADGLLAVPNSGQAGLQAVGNLLDFEAQPPLQPPPPPPVSMPAAVSDAGPSSLSFDVIDGSVIDDDSFDLRDDVYYATETADEKKIEFSNYAKSAELLARQESCAAGIVRIDRMARAVKNQGKKLTDKLELLYLNEFKAKKAKDPIREAKYLVVSLVNAVNHWCKTWSWEDETVCYFTESPQVFEDRTQNDGPVKPFYETKITGKGCRGNVPKCQQLKCYICGGYITDPYISCAYECEHVIDAGTQVLIGRSAVAKDLYGVEDGESYKSLKAPKPFIGDNWDSDLWVPWFFRHYKFIGFLLPFYAFAPSHKCCNQLKSNSHFFGLSKSGQSRDGYIKGSVEDLLTLVRNSIRDTLDKNECKELFREKFAINRLDQSDYTPSTHRDEIRILAPNFSDSDLLLYNPETLNEKWIGWRAIDIIENFIKPINECWKSQVDGMPFDLMLVVSAANLDRQKFKGGKRSKKKTKKSKKKTKKSKKKTNESKKKINKRKKSNETKRKNKK